MKYFTATYHISAHRALVSCIIKSYTLPQPSTVTFHNQFLTRVIKSISLYINPVPYINQFYIFAKLHGFLIYSKKTSYFPIVNIFNRCHIKISRSTKLYLSFLSLFIPLPSITFDWMHGLLLSTGNLGRRASFQVKFLQLSKIARSSRTCILNSTTKFSSERKNRSLIRVARCLLGMQLS